MISVNVFLQIHVFNFQPASVGLIQCITKNRCVYADHLAMYLIQRKLPCTKTLKRIYSHMKYHYRISNIWENIQQPTCATILVRETRVTYTRVISSCQISARNTVQTWAITAANVVCKRSPIIASKSKQKKLFISCIL